MSTVKEKISNYMLFLKQHLVVLRSDIYREKIYKILFVLFIIIVGYFSFTFSHSIANKTVEDIFKISDNIRQFYVDKPNYWGLDTQKVLKENIIDEKYIKDNKISIGKDISVNIGKGKDANTLMFIDNSFDIVIKGLNKSKCISLIEAEISKENIVKLHKITLFNSNGEFNFEWDEGKYSLPVKEYIAKDICSDVDNIVLWTVE